MTSSFPPERRLACYTAFMTDREFFIQTVADEIPRFERLFAALPEEKRDWKPHERSRSAFHVMTGCASEAATFRTILRTGVLSEKDFAHPSVGTIAEAGKFCIKELEDAKSEAAKTSEVIWNSPAKMMMGEKVMWETTRGGMTWSLLLDLIHHRGQLSVYIRPMGGKVPSIYGPSGDSGPEA